jgi:hypothetical protein
MVYSKLASLPSDTHSVVRFVEGLPVKVPLIQSIPAVDFEWSDRSDTGVFMDKVHVVPDDQWVTDEVYYNDLAHKRTPMPVPANYWDHP